ncbi:Peroxin/Ferlin domain-containing protein [Mycena kentingensis (nom. inval.)]|nr:Peroxin/Ferlin domain-containing protein [Mycena kentingensis (nom. inval.)]
MHYLSTTLVALAPSLHLLRRLLETPQSSYDVCLVLAAWWALCLLSEPILRYWIPIVCAAIVLFSPKTRPPPQLASESTLSAAVADLTAIESLLPSIPAISPSLRDPALLARASAMLYVPYLLLTLLVRLRVLVAIAGSVLLSWRAPWAVALRNSLWRNAWFRWSLYRVSAFITGQPLPLAAHTTLSASTSLAPKSTTKSLRFLFTIHENQRWWMGLDWTAALLPAERPSWCSKSQQAVAPPNAFTLPDETSIFLPQEPGKPRLKRCARWSWEEDEWRVIVRQEGAAALTRVEKPLPSEKEENPGLLMKAAVKMRESNSQSSLPSADESEGEKSSVDEQDEDEELVTDEDGWVYGDNKWEKLSSKGGMGKYTRFRRWTRVSVVTESIEPILEGEQERQASHEATTPVAQHQTPPTSPVAETTPRDNSPLRQRLKNAMAKATA